MLFSCVVLCLLGIFSAAYALPRSTRSSHAVKERHSVPDGWTKFGPASKSDSIHLVIGLKLQNETAVEQHLLEVSDPRHHRYGQHLTAEEIQDVVRPSEDTQNAVMSWLEDYGLTGNFSPNKDTIHVLLSIEKAERLLQTSYTTFEHTDGSKIDRAPEWSLPIHLHEHIDVVQPTTSFFRTKPPAPKLDNQALLWPRGEAQGEQQFDSSYTSGQGQDFISQVCNNSFVTPKCIRTLYGTHDYVPQIPQKNGIGQTNYLNGTSHRLDILKLLQAFRPEAADVRRNTRRGRSAHIANR
jgi:tripeptidyl-peptidase I